MDNLDDLLTGSQAFKNILPYGTFRNGSNKFLDHLVVDICFQQCQPYLAQGLIDIFRSEFAITPQVPENFLQSVG